MEPFDPTKRTLDLIEALKDIGQYWKPKSENETRSLACGEGRPKHIGDCITPLDAHFNCYYDLHTVGNVVFFVYEDALKYYGHTGMQVKTAPRQLAASLNEAQIDEITGLPIEEL